MKKKRTAAKNSSSLSEKAYDKIESLIVTLALQPGSAISEGDLVKRTGIGRTPVREALLKLSRERLVEEIPRKGVIISRLNIADHLALLEVRRGLESIIVEHAAQRALPEHRHTFKELATRIKSASDKDRLEDFMQADHEFDQLLAQTCRNPFASEACAPLRTHCRRFWYQYHHDEDLSRSAKFHADIMRAVADGDADEAVVASNTLMDYLEKLTRLAIDK